MPQKINEEEIKRLIAMLDTLLEKLPEEEINKFSKSTEFKTYQQILQQEKEKGKDLAIYAIVAFVLMVSIWGIVNLIAGGLGFSGQPLQNTPKTPTGAV